MSIKSTWGRILLSGASFAAMASPAFAQQAQQPTGAVSDEIVVTATGRQAAIQDVPVAVTAIGAQQLQDAGVRRLTDIEGLAPSFHANVGQSTTAGTVAHIRGIGTGADNPGFESAVGIFIDGVYRARTGVAMSMLPELARVEVLRGPQGTLFGRNTSAGALNIVTAGADFTPSAWGEVSGGNLNLLDASIGGNFPIVDQKVAIRFDAAMRNRDGYITDVLSGQDIDNQKRWMARLQGQFDLTPQTSLRLILDTTHTDEDCCAATPLIYGPTEAAIFSISGTNSTPPGQVGDFNTHYKDREMTVTPGRNYNEGVDEWGASAQLDHDWGNGVSMTYIGSYRNWESLRNQDVDFNKIDIAYRNGLEIDFRNSSHELRFHGTAGRLDWLVGAYYGHEDLNTTDHILTGADTNAYIQTLTLGNTTTAPGGPYQFFAGPPGRPSIFALANPALAGSYLLPSPTNSGQQRDNWHVATDNMSIFTHDQIALSDTVTFTIGARYNRDIKNMAANLTSTSPTCDSLHALQLATGAPGGLIAAFPATLGALMTLACNPAINPITNGGWTDIRHYTAWSGTTSLAWKPTDTFMAYVGYSRGFKDGGFNLDRSGFGLIGGGPLTPATTNPATISASSLAFNSEFTDNYEVGFKSTIFGHTNFNVTAFWENISGYQTNNFNGFNFITRNVPHTVSKGVEAELIAHLTPHLMFNGGVTYNIAQYEDTVVFNTAVPAGNTINKGDPIAQAPKWTADGALTWSHPIGDSLMLSTYLNGQYNSGYRTQTLSREPNGRTDQSAFAIFDGRIGIGPQDQHWALELWGQNLTDKYYFVGAFQATLQTGTYLVYPNAPRTWGVTLRLRH